MVVRASAMLVLNTCATSYFMTYSKTAVQTGRISSTLRFLIAAAIVLAFAFSALNLVVPHWWIADTVVHFRVQYLAIGLLGCALAFWHRQTTMAFVAIVTIVLNVGPVLSYFAVPAINSAHATVSEPDKAGKFKQLRVASANIFSRNDSYDDVVQWVRYEKPDVVVLIETRESWRVAMRQRLPEYPHQRLVVHRHQSGKLILSKMPFDQFDTLPQVGPRSPTPLVTMSIDGAEFRLAALHTNWPMRPTWAKDRNRELERLGDVANQDGPPLVAVGDFNITAFSVFFKAMEQRGNLRRAAAGRGWFHSWPTFFPPAGIQIDHVMVTPQIIVSGYKSGAGLNSDHRWVIADLQIPVLPASFQ